MQVLNNFVSEAVSGFRGILFPGVCLACGEPAIEGVELLCPFCTESRFDLANSQFLDACPGVILPTSIRYQFSLWQYDKGGVLQQLLHSIKYNGMGRLGFELGRLTGIRIKEFPIYNALCISSSTFLAPVPLHPRRKRMRGFNQAEVIALGLSEVLNLEVINDDVIRRKRYTRTQTGFSLTERSRNLMSAFEVRGASVMRGRHVIIVDDVYTTGATTFELAREIAKSNPAAIGIVTIAYA